MPRIQPRLSTSPRDPGSVRGMETPDSPATTSNELIAKHEARIAALEVELAALRAHLGLGTDATFAKCKGLAPVFRSLEIRDGDHAPRIALRASARDAAVLIETAKQGEQVRLAVNTDQGGLLHLRSEDRAHIVSLGGKSGRGHAIVYGKDGAKAAGLLGVDEGTGARVIVWGDDKTAVAGIEAGPEGGMVKVFDTDGKFVGGLMTSDTGSMVVLTPPDKETPGVVLTYTRPVEGATEGGTLMLFDAKGTVMASIGTTPLGGTAEIFDVAGHSVATMGASNGGGGSVSVRAEEGKAEASIFAALTGGMMRICDPRGQTVVMAGVDSTKAMHGLTVISRNATPGIVLGLGPEGEPIVMLSSTEGPRGVMLTGGKEGGRIILTSGMTKPQIVLDASSAEGGMIGILAPGSMEERVVLRGRNDGGSVATFGPEKMAQFAVCPKDKGGMILQLCNDYGMGRVFLAVEPNEAGALIIQHGEEQSLVFVATPDGGKVGSFDTEGEIRATWPAEGDLDDASWWQKADE